MAEWLNAAVLKTALGFMSNGGSNPSPSAKKPLGGCSKSAMNDIFHNGMIRPAKGFFITRE
jgi:hypothetical protein